MTSMKQLKSSEKTNRKTILFIVFSLVIAVCFSPVTFWTTVYKMSQRAVHYDLCDVKNIFNSLLISRLYDYILSIALFQPLENNSSLVDTTSLINVKSQRSKTTYLKIINEIVKIHKPPQVGQNLPYLYGKATVSKDLQLEAQNALHAALSQRKKGRFKKAKKLLEHAKALDMDNPDILTEYGEIFEHETNLVLAEHYYTKAIVSDPDHYKALMNRQRTLPLVEEIDMHLFKTIDEKVREFYMIPESNPGLKRMKKEQYFKHVYHSNAMEGNTLSLAETRSILETRIAIGGKSLVEQNEVLGLDLALRYLNSSLLRRTSPITMLDILEIHKRVLGFVDLTEAGRFRQSQVYVADYTPPPANVLEELMVEFVSWLNSDEVDVLHPLELAALVHWKLVYIHPFYDGNGRTARLLMNLILMRAGYPPAIINVGERHLYYEYIRLANDGDVRPFIRFIAHCSEQTMDELLICAPKEANLSPGFQIESQTLLEPPRVIYIGG